MKAKIRLTNPDNVPMTLELTMPLGQWRRVAEQIGTEHPGWQVRRAIRELIDKAETQFAGESEYDYL